MAHSLRQQEARESAEVSTTSPAEAHRPQPRDQQWTHFLVRLRGDGLVLCLTDAHTVGVHTHTVLFICLCHISPQVESGVSRLTASVQGAIEVWLYRRPKAVSRIAWLPWQRRDHLFAAVMEWYNGPEEGRGGGRTLWGVHQSTARRSTDSVWSIID